MGPHGSLEDCLESILPSRHRSRGVERPRKEAETLEEVKLCGEVRVVSKSMGKSAAIQGMSDGGGCSSLSPSVPLLGEGLVKLTWFSNPLGSQVAVRETLLFEDRESSCLSYQESWHV